MEPQKTNTTAPETRLHFLDYWRIIRIRKTVILAVFLLVVLTTTLVTMILPESYMSTARIAVEKDMPNVPGIRDSGVQFSTMDLYFIQTEFEKIQSRNVLGKVIENLDLCQKWAQKYNAGIRLKPEEAFQIIKHLVDVRQARNTSLIEIRAYSEDREEAKSIANEVAEVYRQTRLDVRKDMTKRGIQTLTDKWKEQLLKVTEAQALVDKLRSDGQIADLTDLDGGGVALVEQEVLRRNTALFLDAQAEFIQVDTMLKELAKKDKNDLKKAIVTATQDQLLSSLLTDFYQAEQKLYSLLPDYAENHPDVLRVRSLMNRVQSQIDERLDGIMSGLQARVNALKSRMDNSEKQMKDARDNQIKTAKQVRSYKEAKMALESAQKIREALNLRQIQETIEKDLPRDMVVEIVDRAEVGLRPVRPNKPLNIILGIIVGLVGGIGLAFFIEYLDTSVKTIDDVERALQSPVLGVIPQNVGNLMDEGPDSPHAEAYRVLRTNVLFARKDDRLNTMTVVSGGAGEGKTTTLFNLAVVFAQNGQRVLIVDSDLRRPSIHKLLRVSNSVGLTNYLLRQNTLEEVIQTTSLPTLDFMASGQLPSSSMGILSSMQMKELIQEVKRRYDFVFFDSPPIMGVSDASILASELDLTLQVIQYRRYPQPMTIRAKQMVEKVGGNLLGIVLNNINMAQDESYYYYSGYYYDYYGSYGYGYGYKRRHSGEYGEYKSGEYKSGEYTSAESKPVEPPPAKSEEVAKLDMDKQKY